jgi:hypothetical protein
VRLEDAVDEPALGRREQELLEEEVAAGVVVDHPALGEDELEDAVRVPERGDGGGAAGLPVAASHSQTIRSGAANGRGLSTATG